MEQGKVEIAASAEVLWEVRKPAAKGGPIADFPAYLRRSFIHWIDLEGAIEAHADRMQSEHGVTGRRDAKHLVYAQHAHASEFHTFDSGILRLHGKLVNAEGEPMRICKPGEGRA